MIPRIVVIRGAGDLASGVAHRLWRSGFNVVMLELPCPLVVRRAVSFASAVYEGEVTVEQVRARFCRDPGEVSACLKQSAIPVLADPRAGLLSLLKPSILVDATMVKKRPLTSAGQASLVIGLGPGFTAGTNAHAVVETERGPNLGRVIYSGGAARNTGVPGSVAGAARQRVLRAPLSGEFRPCREIGDLVGTGETVAYVERMPVCAEIPGLVRGLLYPGLTVPAGLKVGDIDPRGVSVDYRRISDKARAIGGAVLEIIMHRYFNRRKEVDD